LNIHNIRYLIKIDKTAIWIVSDNTEMIN